MLYPSINELRKKVDSRYTLVILASKRARDLIDGYPPLVDIGIDKPVSIATEEIAEDKITYSRKFHSEEEAEQMAEEEIEREYEAQEEALGKPEAGQTGNAETEQADAAEAGTDESSETAGSGQEEE
ncbi:MAG: DNA-directed RNA polymerase subunit omega [Anaerovoracaceae bacterium]|jgi:DNA-directed RNA polymerase subunit omega